MTVLENVLAGSYLQTEPRSFGVIGQQLRARAEAAAKSIDPLHGAAGVRRPGGQDRTSCAPTCPTAASASCAWRSRSASDPTLLLLDEPLTGMNAEETASMIKIIKSVNSERGTTIIVVEHNVRAVLGLCARSVVLNYGQKLMEGTPGECVADPAVIEAYLGTDSDVA